MTADASAERPKVSVVVPIYKVEKYLRQCVDSILGQTLRDIEVILVDDGSPDGCPAIVDEYAAKDPRVVAIHQANGGYGRAVNRGIELATGEYIGIVESDDWIRAGMYERLYKNAIRNDSDIVKCGFYWYDSTASGKMRFVPVPPTIRRAPRGAFSILDYPALLKEHASIWAALYRASFIKGQKVLEYASASYQDHPFMVESVCRAKRISVVPANLVLYRTEEEQDSSSQRSDARLLQLPIRCMESEAILRRYGYYEELKEEFHYGIFMAIHHFFTKIRYRLKPAYFKLMRRAFKSMHDDPTFAFACFSPKQKRFIIQVSTWKFLLSPQLWDKLRQFLVSFKARRNYIRLRVLGISFSIGAAHKELSWCEVAFLKNGKLLTIRRL